MNNPIFVELAEELNDLHNCLYVAGFTEEQAFELTKTLCAYTFEKQAAERRYNQDRLRHADLRRRLGRSIQRMKEDTSDE